MGVEQKPLALAHPTLPFDILADIADELSYEQDTETLRTLCLCSQALVRVCRQHLFRSIVLPSDGHIGTNARTAYLMRLLEVLNSSSQITNHIRELDCYIDKYCAVIPQILERLTCLETFHLRPIYTIDWEVEVVAKNPHLATSIASIVQQNTIRRITLAGLNNFPLSILASISSKHIEFLDISGLRLNGQPIDAGLRLSQNRPPAISSLTIGLLAGPVTTFIDADPPLFDLAPLHTLTICVRIGSEDVNMAFATKFLKAAKNLKTLHCRVPDRGIPLVGLGTIVLQGPSQTLTTLIIDIYGTPYSTFDFPTTSFLGLCPELRVLSGHNALERLEIRFCTYGSHPLIPSHISELDQVFSTEGYPHLRQLSMVVTFRVFDSMDLKESDDAQFEVERSEMYSENCPNIRSMNGLEFRCEVRVDRIDDSDGYFI